MCRCGVGHSSHIRKFAGMELEVMKVREGGCDGSEGRWL